MKPYRQLNEFLPGSFRDEKGDMYFSVQAGKYEGVLHMDGFGKLQEYIHKTCSFHFHRSWDNELGIGLTEGFAIVDMKKGLSEKMNRAAIRNSTNGLKLPKVTTSVKDRYDRWWIGHRASGLACAENNARDFTNFLVAEKRSPYGFWSSCLDYKGNIWFGTGRGLCLLRNSPDMDISNLNLSVDLKQVGSGIFGGKAVFALQVVRERFLLIGYQNGLAILDLERFYATEGKDEVIHIFTDKDGFKGSSVEQNGFYPDAQGRVWIITDEGAFRFDPDLFVWGRNKPTFKILKLIAGTDSLQWNGKALRLKPEVQDVKILLNTSSNPSLKGEMTFLYRTLPNGSWNKSENDSYISLNTSIPGKYVLEILAMRDGVSSDTQVISFEIPYIWHQNPIIRFLFIIGFLMLIVFAILVYYRQRAKLAEHKAELQKERAEAEILKGETERQKSEMARLQVRSIVSQLNPHFTMNALNTLQIISYENPVAVKITGRLADNIRIAFNNTRLAQPYHRLWDEIQMVNNYLCIQKERFEEKLTYRLPSEEELDAHSSNHILLTQILIHCENAVEHGIRNQENGGQVRVLIKDEEDYLHIVVEDEGIGRQRAKEIHSIGTQQGTKMLAELQKIYNAHNKLPIRTEYEDGIYQLSGVEPFGTRVHIWMPKKYYFEIN